MTNDVVRKEKVTSDVVLTAFRTNAGFDNCCLEKKPMRFLDGDHVHMDGSPFVEGEEKFASIEDATSFWEREWGWLAGVTQHNGGVLEPIPFKDFIE